jgi:glutathione synthase/RimK-type ligase-like ATP-grasp enzyme
VPRDDVRRWARLASCPTQFQAYVQGAEFRAHVVADRVWATAITSNGVDYRYTAATMPSAELPADVTLRCVSLAQRLGLTLAGLDLRRTADGRWFCFEVNPSPAFTAFPRADEIATALANFFVRYGALSQPR